MICEVGTHSFQSPTESIFRPDNDLNNNKKSNLILLIPEEKQETCPLLGFSECRIQKKKKKNGGMTQIRKI